jgi:hypothetical protein
MRYSQYFVKVREFAAENKAMAVDLLREAERYASKSVAYDLCLCAQSYRELLDDQDNALRCIYFAEVRFWNDCRELLSIADFYLKVFNDQESAARCALKASEFSSSSEDWTRLEDFFQSIGRHELAEKCRNSFLNHERVRPATML